MLQLTFKYVLYDEIALCDHYKESHVRPSEETELPHVVSLHQRQHEPDEADAVQAEGDEAVVGHQGLEVVLGTKQMLNDVEGKCYEIEIFRFLQAFI